MLQINDNGIFVDMAGNPVDREGMPIDGEIDPATGFIMASDGSNTTLGPNGMKLPDTAILPPTLTVDADGVPRNASGESPSTRIPLPQCRSTPDTTVTR